MATNKPVGDNARKGAVRKRSQTKTTMGGDTTWTKRNESSGKFMAIKKAKKAAPKKAAAFKKKVAAKTTVVDQKPHGPSRIFTEQELYGLRRSMLHFARSFPPGGARNRHRQTALSLRALFIDSKWLAEHSVDLAAARFSPPPKCVQRVERIAP